MYGISQCMRSNLQLSHLRNSAKLVNQGPYIDTAREIFSDSNNKTSFSRDKENRLEQCVNYEIVLRAFFLFYFLLRVFTAIIL